MRIVIAVDSLAIKLLSSAQTIGLRFLIPAQYVMGLAPDKKTLTGNVWTGISGQSYAAANHRYLETFRSPLEFIDAR